MEPLATWELGLSGNGTRQPLPALPWPLHRRFARGVPSGVPPPHHSTQPCLPSQTHAAHPKTPYGPISVLGVSSHQQLGGTGLAGLGQCSFPGAPGRAQGVTAPWLGPGKAGDSGGLVSLAGAAG